MFSDKPVILLDDVAVDGTSVADALGTLAPSVMKEIYPYNSAWMKRCEKKDHPPVIMYIS